MQTPATADTEGQPLRALIRAARRTLDDAGVPSPAADARILARHVLECTDGGILELVDEVSPAFEDLFDSLVERRARREPLQLITGEVHFHAVRLATAPGVFIPRPETEQLTESAIRALLADDGSPVGTSGAPSAGVGADDGAPVRTSGAPSAGVGGDGGGSVGTSGAPSMGVGGDGEASVGTSGAPSMGVGGDGEASVGTSG
ncbi:MAG TPA: hypothetical protein GX743_04460, partial [Actinomycetales bacterium]|nr:hypothetical protein [Actinomycetales bacterium]